MLCADLVDIQWKDKDGRTRETVANLEDISLSGACVQTELPIPLKTVVRITYPKGRLQGTVQHCEYRQIGYYLGIGFDEEFRWSLRKFKPQHFLDPRRLLSRASKGVKQSREALAIP